jgi:hypothetical protein
MTPAKQAALDYLDRLEAIQDETREERRREFWEWWETASDEERLAGIDRLVPSETPLTENPEAIAAAARARGAADGRMNARRDQLFAHSRALMTSQLAAQTPQRPAISPARSAPRPRGAGRPRALAGSSSRGGDSGDDGPGESDLPPLARLGRAIRRARFERVPGSVAVRLVFRPDSRGGGRET